jgi:hypothetical protein
VQELMLQAREATWQLAQDLHYPNQPEAWNMRLVLGIATVLGTVGPLPLQTLMYLMLSVAGNQTVFRAPHPRPVWSVRPARRSRPCSAHRNARTKKEGSHGRHCAVHDRDRGQL